MQHHNKRIRTQPPPLPQPKLPPTVRPPHNGPYPSTPPKPGEAKRGQKRARCPVFDSTGVEESKENTLPRTDAEMRQIRKRARLLSPSFYSSETSVHCMPASKGDTSPSTTPPPPPSPLHKHKNAPALTTPAPLSQKGDPTKRPGGPERPPGKSRRERRERERGERRVDRGVAGDRQGTQSVGRGGEGGGHPPPAPRRYRISCQNSIL
jgi:hypothetical protein